MITARVLRMKIAAGSMSTRADSAIPNMLTAVEQSQADQRHEQEVVGQRGKRAAQAGRPGGQAYGDGEDVIDDHGRRGQQARPAAQVGLGHRIGAAALGMGVDHLGVGDDEQASMAVITTVSGRTLVTAPVPASEEHDDHRLRAVGDARERVEAQRGQAAEDAELVALFAVLAPTQNDPPISRRFARRAMSGSRSPDGPPASRLEQARWPPGTACATAEGDCWSSWTAAFILMIAGKVSSALTLLIVCVKAGPSVWTRLFLTTGATFWKPKSFFVSVSTVYLPAWSCGSVVKIVAIFTCPESSAL